MNEIQGWINLYKPKNITSFKCIDKIKKNFLIKKIGHAGTLDPLAEGILPIAIGKATKLISFINNDYKRYKFTITWGEQTTTDDSMGKIINKTNMTPNLVNISSKLDNYIGDILQRPPKVSAVKVNGVRAYKLFRENKEFDIKLKKVFVRSLKIIHHNNFHTSFEIECGKGFYIRSLARDLSKELGIFGHISALERVNVGKFEKKNSILLDDLLKISERLSGINCILPSVSMLDDILAVEIDKDIDLKDISLGRSIKIEEYKLKYFSSELLDSSVLLSNKGDVVSVGKLIGNLFKPNKVLI